MKLLLAAALSTGVMLAQNAGTVRGSVTDPSAAVVPGATVQLVGNGTTRNAKTDGQGKFTMTLPPGAYNVRADAKGFVTYLQQNLNVSAGQVSPLDIALQIAAEAQEVQVSDQAAGQVSVDPSSNVGALVLKNEDLDALPDDPDDLQADLQALAGPASGPNGAQFFVDGFSGGQLPPKSSIREIRINSNPFSSEFDRPGFGRIEILTKPGTDAFHGSGLFNYGDRILDTRNPFLTGNVPGYSTKMFSVNLGGPINKKSSFFLDINRRQINEDNLIKAQTLDNNFNEVPYIGAFAVPNRLLMLSGRIDYALSPTDTLVMRYTHSQNSNEGGVGGFALPSQLTKSIGKNNQVQITETSVLGTKAVDETRFQFRDNHAGTNAVASPGTGINVSGAFNAGGPPFTQPDYTFNKNFELQNILTFTQGTHAIKVGGRARQDDITDFSTSNFNGSYSFSLGGTLPQCLASYAVGGYIPTSLDLYRQTQLELSQGIPIATIIGQGCGPSQFTLSSGSPLVNVRQFDVGLFVQDDWRFRPNLTISLGVRYESQNNIHDHNDWAPRVAIAWAPWAKKNAPSKTVIRAGFGIFYDRIAIGDSESSLRNNGFTQQSYQLSSTNVPLSFYPNLPPASALGGATLIQQNIDLIDRAARAPYMMQSAVTLERSLPGRTTLSVNLVDSRGVHTLRTRDINAPLPGTYTGIGTGILPYAGFGPIYQYETSGLYKQLQTTTNVNTRFNRRFSLNGYYSLNFAHSNAQGLPMNQYNDDLDYGRAQFDVRHRGYFGGTIQLPYAVQAAPFVTMQSGSPFNITDGLPFNGDGIYNARPALA
ncbi:MAG TPA: TonB-dependent receptor, partial [Bryobacteraceae bacterium]|nr:TonB-dependent receptor [Bryobacteraceae bacterium]